MFRALRIAIATIVATGAFVAVASATVSPTGPATLTATTGVKFGTMDCTGSGGSATIANSPVVTSNLQLTFTGCSTPSASYTVACAATATLTATGRTSGGVTPLALRSISCTVRDPVAMCTSTITGSVLTTFNNASSALLVTGAGQSLAYGAGSTCSGMTTMATRPPAFSASPSVPTYTVSPTTTMTF
jgi:hypothetical protein